MIYVIILLIVGIGGYLFLKNTQSGFKSSSIKKDEIIKQYEDELKKILEKYKDDKTTQLEQKKLFLKKCNSELSRNIFFTPNEASSIIQKLAGL